jgi:hypothetical protein
VLEVVDWPTISKGSDDAWLYFYEDFLAVYDNDLRKLTGSYYTPAVVVGCMVKLVDEALRRPAFGLHAGLASSTVTIADPATGTYLLGVLRHIAQAVAAGQGPGAVAAAVQSALRRLVAFEIQLGPFAVAQLRIAAEVLALTDAQPKTEPRMFVTDTLAHTEDVEDWFSSTQRPIADQRLAANRIKRDEPITVVIGNPPYKEKAKGRGGWVEGRDGAAEKTAPLAAWMPPKAWQVGVHSKHLRNLYVYFWRWATWKVFDQQREAAASIVCYITVAGFLGGPGFQAMRAYLRRSCDEIWVIDCSPDGHQPEVATRIFQGVQQPVCIVLASRSAAQRGAADRAAAVRWRALPMGRRDVKFDALRDIALDGPGWVDSPTEARAPFLPAASKAWNEMPALEEFFVYNGSGVMPGRTWVIAPDAESLKRRWATLVGARASEKERLFHPHVLKDGLGDRHVGRVVSKPLAGYPETNKSVADEGGPCLAPVRYGFRSFDREWIIPDSRLINRPNPRLWTLRSGRQIYATAFTEESPTNGPALTLTALIPDLHHYKGSFGGRAFPLWLDAEATQPNLRPALLVHLSTAYGFPVGAEDLFAYLAAIAAHPAYLKRFAGELATPGLRIPLTADPATFTAAVAVGRRIVWLHCFGERMADPAAGRPAAPPRLPLGRRPQVPQDGAIPATPEAMPDHIAHDAIRERLQIGSGFIEPVTAAVWRYEVSGKAVIKQWFSYRAQSRERPIIGDRRPPSPLGEIQPETWLAEYTSELLDLINVLGLLVDLEPEQAALLDRVCGGPLIPLAAL